MSRGRESGLHVVGAHADIEWVSLAGTETCARVLTETAIDYCR
jgi:hypothetical protein